MKRVYVMAILIGTALAFFITFSAALLGDDIPGWPGLVYFSPLELKPVPVIHSGTILDLQHRAVLLRFCMLILDCGMSVLAISIGLCLPFAALEDAGDKHYVLMCFRKSLKMTGLVLLGMWILLSLLVWTALFEGCALEAMMLAWLRFSWRLLPLGVIGGIPVLLGVFLFYLGGWNEKGSPRQLKPATESICLQRDSA